ncbi:uncharacterized protein LOC131664196 isoform X2 [Phymastichus coffea]|nr:uncharacterized protein LOC131664196 isoform X2 [Phymastichus coffea]
MPPDISYESIKSIISFMYTGQLEYWASEHNDLYRTAQKLKMSILIKLLDAQLNQTHSISATKPEVEFTTDKQQVIFQRKPFFEDTASNEKSPFIKRKQDDDHLLQISKSNIDFWNSESHLGNSSSKNYQGPSRFDLPEIDELTLGVFSSFDDITYNTQPIVQAPERMNYSNKIFSTFINDSSNLEPSNKSNFSRKEDGNSDISDDDWSQSYFTKMKEVQHISKNFRFDTSNKENFKKLEHFSNNTETSVEVVDNHAKIIREVLKKYPHLVQQSKNIRLKIMQKETKNSECATTGRTKISYVVLKSDSLMANNSGELDSNCSTMDNDEMGPWKCAKCSLDEKYINYFMYRRHMQDVHNEKFDPRICEHCGYKATKRNILMYHMYTKHNITPPKNMTFPKCKVCNYIGLSESLLARHQANHKNQLVNISPTLHLDVRTKRNVQSKEDRKINLDTEMNCCKENIKLKSCLNLQNKCSECGKHFRNSNSLLFHLKSHQHEISQCESLISEPTSSEMTLSMNNDCQINDIKEANAEIECHTMIENTPQSNNNELLENSKISYKLDSKIYCDTSTYIQHRENCRSNTICNFTSSKNFINNFEQFEDRDEIVTEVVEEIQEPMQIEMNNFDYGISNNFVTNYKRKHRLDHILDSSDHTKVNIGNIENAIQYVEEETEILEYETN